MAYNKYMNGVDKNDQKLSYYSIDRKTIKWYKKIFKRTLHYSVVNLHEMFKIANPGTQMTLLNFTLEICRALTGLPHPKDNPMTTTTSSRPDCHECVKIPVGELLSKKVQRMCCVCKMKGKKGSFQCLQCPKEISGYYRAFHELCFYKYHYNNQQY